jgi:DNA primase
VVALMGSSLSERQCRRLSERFDQVQVLMDGDRAGRDASETIAVQLAPHVWLKVAVCPEGCQPDDLTPDQLTELLR